MHLPTAWSSSRCRPTRDCTPVPLRVKHMPGLSCVATESICGVICGTQAFLKAKNHVYVYFKEGVVARMSCEERVNGISVLQRNRTYRSNIYV